MNIHHYDPHTGIYQRSTVADESPLEPGVHLIPAHATTDQLPELGTGEIAVWTGDAWQKTSPAQPTLEWMKQQSIAAIKATAGKIILTRLPAWKQNNLTARAIELLAGNQTMLPEFQNIQDQWEWVKNVRQASDIAEANITLAVNQVEVTAALTTGLAELEMNN